MKKEFIISTSILLLSFVAFGVSAYFEKSLLALFSLLILTITTISSTILLEGSRYLKAGLALISTIILEVLVFSLGYYPSDNYNLFNGIAVFALPFIARVMFITPTNNQLELILKVVVVLFNLPLFFLAMPLAFFANESYQLATIYTIFILSLIYVIYSLFFIKDRKEYC